MLSIVGFGLVGFVDDYLKIIRGQSLGLNVWQKLIAQVGVALGIGCLLYTSDAADE